MTAQPKYVLEIEWTKPDLPNLVGPFDSCAEAEKWARINIPNGSWNVAPLARPYAGVDHVRGRG